LHADNETIINERIYLDKADNLMTGKLIEAHRRLDVQLKIEVLLAIRDLQEERAEQGFARCATFEFEIGRRLVERLEAAGWSDAEVSIAAMMTLGLLEEVGRESGDVGYRLTANGRSEVIPSERNYESEAIDLILQRLEDEGLIKWIQRLQRV
jgi:hypothetical protein